MKKFLINLCFASTLLINNSFAFDLGLGNDPEITSGTTFSIVENSSDVTTVIAEDSDNDTVTFSIDGGDDATSFSITNDGILTFSTAPDYENPTDSGSDNIYHVTVKALDENGGSDAVDITITVTDQTSEVPEYQNEYSCGIFPSVLASYQNISVQQNDVFNTCKISVGLDFIEDANHEVTCWKGEDESLGQCDQCTGDRCSSNGTCEIIPEPTNYYDHYFIDTEETGTLDVTCDLEFTDLYHPSYNISTHGNNTDVLFNPQSHYENNTSLKKVMVLGDVDFVDNGTEITFESGDYYFNSLTLNNTPDINVNGDVRLFVKNDFIYSGNHMDMLNEGSLFVYVGGDMAFTSEGGGKGYLDMFVYVEGSATINSNANASSLFGGITAEGSINITGQNMNFVYNEAGAANIGFGDCELCYISDPNNHTSFFGFFPKTVTPIINNSGETLTDVVVEESYSSSGYIGSNLEVQDQDGNEVPGSSTSSSSDKLFMLSHGGGTNTYLFGPEGTQYAPSDGTEYYQTSQSALFDFGTFLNWEESIRYVANYTDSSERNYEVILEECSELGGIGQQPTLGGFDAWDNPEYDNNITTKIANVPFELLIISLDENGQEATKPLVDAQFQLYDYESDTNVSSWFPFSSSIHSVITQPFNVPQAYRDVRVRFKFCQSETNASMTAYSDCVDHPDLYDYNSSVISRDNFAIRPNSFSVTPINTEILSALGQNFTVTAQNPDGSSVVGYTVSNALYDLNVTENRYMRNNDINNSLNGDATISSFSFTNGVSSNVLMDYSDIGFVNLNIEDRDWAAVDISDTTPNDCSATGRYICGDTNETFIPTHFTLSNATLNNNAGLPFTYLSNDLNMSSSLNVTITARNNLNNTAVNFDSASWENPVSVSLTVTTPNTPTPNIMGITAKKIGFSNGVSTVAWNDVNSSLKVMLNFQRDLNTTVNPFDVNGSDVSVNATSVYTSTTISGTPITTDQNATFIYGRTYAPRSRVVGNSGPAFIYYEVYCEGTGCEKTLLPDGVDSNSTEDPRWYVNTQHVVSAGTAGVVTQKGAALVSSTTPGGSHQDSVTLNYNGSKGYPYKTTMENTPSPWLVYNKNDATLTDTTNEFKVEFEGSASDWAGVHNDDVTTTKKSSSETVNRRSMW